MGPAAGAVITWYVTELQHSVSLRRQALRQIVALLEQAEAAHPLSRVMVPSGCNSTYKAAAALFEFAWAHVDGGRWRPTASTDPWPAAAGQAPGLRGTSSLRLVHQSHRQSRSTPDIRIRIRRLPVKKKL